MKVGIVEAKPRRVIAPPHRGACAELGPTFGRPGGLTAGFGLRRDPPRVAPPAVGADIFIALA